MGSVKVVNLVIDDYGNYLGMEKGCIILKDRKGKVQRFPLFEQEIGEVVLCSGNMVSTGVLATLGFWQVDVLITTRNGRPIAMLKSLEDDAHVKTRISQYEALKNGKGMEVAKKIVLARILGQNEVLKKYGLRQLDVMGVKEALERLECDSLRSLRKRLLLIESHSSRKYFQEIFQLFPSDLRPEKRSSYLAYDGINNLFNLAYELLFWKCYRALSKAHLETHLGFIHSLAFGRPSLVCDFMEIYRYLVEDFLLGYAKTLKPKDFKAETVRVGEKKGKRIYLKKAKTKELTRKLFEFFKVKVKVPRVRHGEKQEIESLITEEAFLLAKYLRNERKSWNPRIVNLQPS